MVFLDLQSEEKSQVEAIAKQQSLTQPKYKSSKLESLIFEGVLIPRMPNSGDSIAISVFSDDGIDVEVNGKLIFNRFGKGQHLPSLKESLHDIPGPDSGKWIPGKSYFIRIKYSNIIFTGDADIDGLTIFAYNGGGVVPSVELKVTGTSANAKLNPGAYIPINAGNLNGSKENQGFPSKYDFEVSPLPKLSPKLVKVEPVIQNLPANDSFSVELRLDGKVKAPGAKVKFWKTQDKRDEFVLPIQWQPKAVPSALYLEGIHEGNSEREHELVLVVSDKKTKQVIGTDRVQFTVTPILELLWLAENKKAAPNLENLPDLGWSLNSRSGGGKNATVTFALKTIRTNADGEVKIIQFARNTNNLKGGFGADFGKGMTFDYAAPHAKKWLVDSTKLQLPYYTLDPEYENEKNNMNVSPTDRVLFLFDMDSPALPVNPVLPPVNGKTNVDVSYEFTTFAVWQFKDNTLYVLGNGEWKVRYAGEIASPAKGKYGFAPTKNNGTIGNNKVFSRTNQRLDSSNKEFTAQQPPAEAADPGWR